jgi:hypothetical protein
MIKDGIVHQQDTRLTSTSRTGAEKLKSLLMAGESSCSIPCQGSFSRCTRAALAEALMRIPNILALNQTCRGVLFLAFGFLLAAPHGSAQCPQLNVIPSLIATGSCSINLVRFST